MNRYAFTSPYVPFAWEITRGSADLMKKEGRELVLKNDLDSIYENTYLWDQFSEGAIPQNSQTDNKKDDITDEILNKRDIIAANEQISEKTTSEISSIGILYELLINVCRAQKEPLSREIYLNITM